MLNMLMHHAGIINYGAPSEITLFIEGSEWCVRIVRGDRNFAFLHFVRDGDVDRAPAPVPDEFRLYDASCDVEVQPIGGRYFVAVFCTRYVLRRGGVDVLRLQPQRYHSVLVDAMAMEERSHVE